MSSYNPPTENLPTFNSSLFNQPEEILSQAEADLLYLSKTKNNTSTATLTTFNGQMLVKGQVDLGTQGIGGTITYINRALVIKQIDGVNSGDGLITFSGGPTGTLGITARNPADNLINTDIKFITRGAGSATDNLQMTIANTSTKITNNLDVGTNGSSNSLSIRGEERLYDTASPYTTYSKISTSGVNVNYESPNGVSTAHIFKVYNSAGTLTGSIFDITQFNLISRLTHSFASRLVFQGATYSFPFSNQSLGYYSKETGTGTSVSSATPTTILTTSSIGIGVWRIDFSVQNVVGAAGAGTITQAQSYISTTLNGAVATAVSFTGSILRSHISEVYGNNDVQIITSSFTYNQTTAGVLYLNIVRTFATGTYAFTGEISITRLA